MATLEKIRNRAGLLIGVVGVALFAFIIGDFLNSGNTYFGPSRERVGKVAGRELSIFEFQQEMATLTEVMKMHRQTPSDGEIRDMVWNSFVEESLLLSEAEKVGLSITSTELAEVTLGENMHPLMRQIPLFYNEQGIFDQSILPNVLNYINTEEGRQLRDYWLYWENRIKRQVLTDKYQTLIIKAMAATNAEATIVADLNSKETDAACARRMFYSVPDSIIPVSDKELQAKYEAIKEQRFKTDGYRSLKTVIFDIIPSAEDHAGAESAVQEAKIHLQNLSDEELALFIPQETDPSVPFNPYFRTENEIDPVFRDFAFIAPKGSVSDVMFDNGFYKTAKVMSNVELRSDSVKISHILVQRATEEESQRVADSLLAELKKGADFATLVVQYSANTSTIMQGGDLGWMTEGTVGLENFDNTVFPARVGEIVTVAIPMQGVHVIKITEKTAPVKKVRLAEIANRVEPSTATISRIYNQANQFVLTNRTLESFQAAAIEQGLMIRPLDRLNRNQSSVYLFEQSRPIIRWAWENKEGAVSEVFEVPNMFVVAAVSEAVEEGHIPFRFVTEQVKAEFLKDRKAELLIGEMKGITDLGSISPVDTLKNIRFSQVSFGSVGREPVIAAMARATNVDQISVPVRGNMGVYVLKVLDKREVPADANMEIYLLNNNIFSTVSRGIFESLKKNAKIEDNRFNFF